VSVQENNNLFCINIVSKKAELVEKKLRKKAVERLHGYVSRRLSIKKASGNFFCVLSAAPEALEQVGWVVGVRVRTEEAA
jgi:hypothetical protein